ncbi:coiled-coil domain-containing protein 172 [Chanos chanos]|uniref:Coiled-coil domain-containing protein 172 n=1 Tax=Chanos chanos TaxID=29144 RepID=A0A6J2V792_CHACN|nr:coiled-coil domain-containing protein 172 [Chanos chanos]
MSLESLFQLILLAEQQFSENSRQLHKIKAEISSSQEKIRTSTEVFKCAKRELDEKTKLLAETKLQQDIVNKCLEQREKLREELFQEQNKLKECLDQIRLQASEEQEKFLNDIMTFNSDYSLLNNREAVLHSQMRSEIDTLQLEEDSVKEEMEDMIRSSSCMNSIQTEKRSLISELQNLESDNRELERELKEAAVLTESLRAERLSVSQKPVTDSTCLRLKKELEMQKEGELELLHAALTSEIQFLRSVITHRHNLIFH